jgi:hypothetical protein
LRLIVFDGRCADCSGAVAVLVEEVRQCSGPGPCVLCALCIEARVLGIVAARTPPRHRVRRAKAV